MIKVDFAEPQTDAWRKWKTKCEAAGRKAQEIVAKSSSPPSVTDLYKKQRKAIEDGFGGKCAFCEKKITSTQFGDIEHYRPKAGVQELDWSAVQFQRDGRTGAHHGYWWLAYASENLLFSCIACNQVARSRKYGKGNRFPVDGFRAELPREEADETPLLLNPIIEEPSDHIAFDETGVCSPVDEGPKGRVSIDLLGLNERGLPNERAERYQNTVMRFNQLLFSRPPGWLDQLIEMQQSKDAEFSAVVREAIKKMVEEVKQLNRLDEVGDA